MEMSTKIAFKKMSDNPFLKKIAFVCREFQHLTLTAENA